MYAGFLSVLGLTLTHHKYRLTIMETMNPRGSRGPEARPIMRAVIYNCYSPVLKYGAAQVQVMPGGRHPSVPGSASPLYPFQPHGITLCTLFWEDAKKRVWTDWEIDSRQQAGREGSL